MIYELLPLLEGWSYHYVEKRGKLELGEEVVIDSIDYPGYLLSALASASGSLDAKHVRVRVEFRGTATYPIEYSAYDICNFGLLGSADFAVRITVYDDVNKRYAGIVDPKQPMPIPGGFTVKLIPPAFPIEEPDATAIDYYATYSMVKITNIEEFRYSIAKVFEKRKVATPGPVIPIR